MKKIYVIFLLSISGLFSLTMDAYTHILRNYTLEELEVKLDLKWAADVTVTVAPAQTDSDGNITSPGITKYATGCVCTNGFTVFSSVDTKSKELDGWCLIPGFTKKSKGCEICVHYKDSRTLTDPDKYKKEIKITVN